MDVKVKCRVEINREACTGCGYCLGCEQKALSIGAVLNHYGVYPVQRQVELCQGCGHCYYVCPEPGAITLYQ